MRPLLAACAAALALASAAHAQDTPAARAEAREILARAVGFDSSVIGKQNPALAAYLAGRFAEAGFPAADIHVLPFGETAALVVRYAGDGTGGRPILWLAHMDVVPALRADWERDPFTMVEENGLFFGRGSLDNKSGLVSLTAAFLNLKRSGFTPTRDLILVFSGDEETSGDTTQAILADHRALLGDAEFAINSDAGGGSLDPSGRAVSYTVQAAEKTFASFALTARNPGGHSSQPRADNAIYDVVDALTRVRAYQFPAMWNETTLASFRVAGPATGGAVGAAMVRYAARPGDRRAAATLSASPLFVGQVRTTCIPTLLQAGHADNALPQSATATVNCRIFPGVAVADVQAKLQELAGDGVSVTPLDDYASSPASPLHQDVMDAITAAVHAHHPDVPITPSMSAGATDGVFYRGAGIPTYGASEVFLKDEDEFAHGLNERVPVESFYDGLTHWPTLIRALAGPR
jgi:acetylornithine deacetylase/succinyl-diaminopimelate desuccinylase-like protein